MIIGISDWYPNSFFSFMIDQSQSRVEDLHSLSLDLGDVGGFARVSGRERLFV